MRILLDENVPEPLIEPLSWLLKEHQIAHVGKRWKGIKDLQLYSKAKRNDYELIISADGNQLYDAEICKAIQRSGLHAVFLDAAPGLDALAAATGALTHSIRGIVATTEKAEAQRVIVIPMLSGRGSYEVFDPQRQAPSPMWPRKQYGQHKPSRNTKK